MCENVLVSENLQTISISAIECNMTWFIEKMLIYNDLCLNKCPSDTYAEDEEIVNDATGEKGIRSVCKPCTKEKCHKSNLFIQLEFSINSTVLNIRNGF